MTGRLQVCYARTGETEPNQTIHASWIQINAQFTTRWRITVYGECLTPLSWECWKVSLRNIYRGILPSCWSILLKLLANLSNKFSTIAITAFSYRADVFWTNIKWFAFFLFWLQKDSLRVFPSVREILHKKFLCNGRLKRLLAELWGSRRYK
jgi:hypothetical protein